MMARAKSKESAPKNGNSGAGVLPVVQRNRQAEAKLKPASPRSKSSDSW